MFPCGDVSLPVYFFRAFNITKITVIFGGGIRRNFHSMYIICIEYILRLNHFHILYKIWGKIIVTFFETKKRDLEHYGLSDEVDVFFNFGGRFSKMDIYKCPISEIGGRDLNFLYIIHFGEWEDILYFMV
jgi:hypothetical protein